MASQAARRRARKARAAARAADASAKPKHSQVGGRQGQVIAAPKSRHVRRDDGLDALRSKGRVTPSQEAAGREYGMLYRAAAIEGGASIRAVDLDAVRGGGGGGGGMAPSDLLSAEWITQSRVRLAMARTALGHHPEMIAVCDLICGRGVKPREITTVQREAEQIETALRLALDLLRNLFNEERRAPAEAVLKSPLRKLTENASQEIRPERCGFGPSGRPQDSPSRSASETP